MGGELDWLGRSNVSHGSELDARGDDAVGLGIALGMDLNVHSEQYGSSRFVGLEGGPIMRSASEPQAPVGRHRPPPSADYVAIENRSGTQPLTSGVQRQWGHENDHSSGLGGGLSGLSPQIGSVGSIDLSSQMFLGVGDQYSLPPNSTSDFTNSGGSSQDRRQGTGTDPYHEYQYQELNSNSAAYNPDGRSWLPGSR